ncbi:uncharacterized protein [Rutidosis leptorrhynchoides]|uniref:uncharacterized protein n=1 Tax=Rutidosis leptorrhynchoides TaxID=125765 RepID=UPI003A9A1A9E
MKVLSLNVRGFAVSGKFGLVRNLCVSEKLCVATFQETKCNTIDDRWISALWGGSNFGYVQKEAIGKSGGLITIWDPSVFDVSDCSDRFNDFITRNGLIEIGINGRKFTRISDDDLKFSKIDRHLLDHCPLVLRDKLVDSGPKPFKVFDEWFNFDEIDKVIMDAWGQPIQGSRKDCNFRDRLKNVKFALKGWSVNKFGGLDKEIDALKKEVSEWELKAE